MSVVGEFLSWWGAQLRGLLPSRRAGLGDGLVAEVEPGLPDMRWAQRRRGREQALDTSDPGRVQRLLAGRAGQRVLLRVPADAVLERTLTLPLAAEPELPRVVAYEVDRLTPFSKAEVAWAHEVEARDRAAGRLRVRVALLPRVGLEPAMERLREWGATPAAVLAPGAGGKLWSISLQGSDAAGGAGRRRALAALAGTCAVLAAVSAGLPFALQERALRREESRIERLRPVVAQADILRRRVSERASGGNALAAEAARVGQVLNALATLTTLLPDDTYLTAFAMRQRVLTLAGRSASAARLIPLLAADPAIRNAAFAAPVTRVTGAAGDVFSIRAEFGS